jgi:hypothetical protein
MVIPTPQSGLRTPNAPAMIGRTAEWDALTAFATSGVSGPSLGLVWGRRRVGKSYLLETLAEQTGGFYYQAIRGSSAEALRDLGERLGEFQGAAAPLALADWERGIEALLLLGETLERPVILDEFPYLLEHTPELASIIQRALGTRRPSRGESRARLILCGSAITVMSQLLAGTAPLRGRAGLDLRVSPFDYRVARELHGIEQLPTAVAAFATIGGVAAYAREMSEHDMPADAPDFARWICRRVLSPAAPLFSEIELLLSEDPAMSKARKINLYHATLAGIATGHHAWSSLCAYVKTASASLLPIVDALIAAELVVRIDDPIRDRRPTYHPGDSLLRFHYAVTRRHHARLARHSADTGAIWADIEPTFRSQVLGPCFETMARYWTQHFATRRTLGGSPDHVGSTVLTTTDDREQQLDVVVAADDGAVPSQRTVHAIGEAKVGETITTWHLQRLEQARAALGPRAAACKLLLFGRRFDAALSAVIEDRADVEAITLERLYLGD